MAVRRRARTLPVLPVLMAGIMFGFISGAERARAQDGAATFSWGGDHAVVSVVRVGGRDAELRSGPDDNYKMVTLAPRGSALPRVGSNPSYFQVLVPEGYHAFVHRRYLDVPASGPARVNTDHVNVRSQPSSSSDYPIGQLNSGTEITIVKAAEGDGEWYEIVAPRSLPLWVRQDAVEDLGPLTPELRAEIDDEASGNGVRSGGDASTINARARMEQDRAELDRLATVVENAQKSAESVDLAGSRESVQEILAHATDPAIRDRAVELDGRIRALEQIQEREKARRETERTQAEVDARRREAEAAAARAADAAQPGVAVGQGVTMTGFVRVRPDDGGHPFALEQGTKRLAWITCASGRYGLRDFAGLQVTISGTVTGRDTLPVLDAQRVEIVKH